jgi:hypothetical protein
MMVFEYSLKKMLGLFGKKYQFDSPELPLDRIIHGMITSKLKRDVMSRYFEEGCSIDNLADDVKKSIHPLYTMGLIGQYEIFFDGGILSRENLTIGIDYNNSSIIHFLMRLFQPEQVLSLFEKDLERHNIKLIYTR